MFIKKAKSLLESKGYLVEDEEKPTKRKIKIIRKIDEIDDFLTDMKVEDRLAEISYHKVNGYELPTFTLFYDSVDSLDDSTYNKLEGEDMKKILKELSKKVEHYCNNMLSNFRFSDYFKLDVYADKDELIVSLIPELDLFDEDLDDIKYVYNSTVKSINPLIRFINKKYDLETFIKDMK